MFHDLNVLAGGILVAWFTALLFGILLSASLAYIRLVVAQGLRRAIDWIMFSIVILQLLISAAHCALCLQQALYGYVYAPNPVEYFLDQGVPTHVGQTILYITNQILADSILVWRLYMVYGRNRYIVGPYIILIIGSTVCGAISMHILTTTQNQVQLFSLTQAHWQDTYWALTISIQTSASCLIAWKIWTTESQTAHMKQKRSSRSMAVLWMILESGAVLSSTTIILLGFYVTKKWAGDVVAAISGQLAALVPVSILLRVALTKVEFNSGSITSGSWPTRATINVKHDVESFPMHTVDTSGTTVLAHRDDGSSHTHDKKASIA